MPKCPHCDKPLPPRNWESTIQLALWLVPMTLILWLTASKFDHTEITTIVGTFATAIGAKGFLNAVRGGN